MIKVLDLPSGEQLCGLYRIECEGRNVPVAYARVSAMPYNTEWPGHQRPIDQTEDAGFIRIQSDGAVTLCVTYSNEKAPGEVIVRPMSKQVKTELDGKVCRLTLPGVGQYTLEADGFHNALHIFIDPIKEFTADGKVIRFDAGVHEIGNLWVESNTMVIVDTGAVVYGTIGAIDAENVKICGYGIIDGSREVRTNDTGLLPYDYYNTIPEGTQELLKFFDDKNMLHGCVRFFRCKNCLCEGVTMRDSATFALIPANCVGITIDNVKTIGMWRYNSDGIDIFNCADVTIKNSFLRDFDDCIVIKGICGWDKENNQNITVENCVVWCDWGRSLEIGAETNAPEYKNIIFRNCDLIHGSTAYMDLQHHNYADIHDMVFDDIRAEYTKYQLSDSYQFDMNKPYVRPTPTNHPILCWTPIFHMNLFSVDGKNGITHDIVFKNIKVLTDDESIEFPRNICQGYDAEHTVERVNFENFTFNGKPVEFSVIRNEFTKDIEVK